KDAYDKALADAEKVLKDPNASQDDVNKAKQALEEAEKALNGEAVDKAPLQSEVDKNKADAIKGSDKYKNADQDKKDAYDKALADAKKVLEDPNASQDDVNKAKKALEEAEKALNGKASKDADKISPNLPGNTKVGNKDKLTDEEKSKIADKIKEANKDKFPVGTNISVDDKGNVTITYPDGSKDIIPAEKLVSEKSKASTPAENTNAENNPAVNPGKIVVDDKNNLTNKEKSEIADKVKKINPKASKIEVANDGSVTITYPDGSTNKIAGKDLVIEKAKGQGTRKAQVNANNAPSQAKSVNKSTNVQTGIESQAGIIATLLASVGGLFASKKRKNK
ncbi:MAG: FIVAR domain-containing protein, partial [Anaerococcus hydrogenalis]|nr:FIVAR domain-containing protein [Anaerococcus hydrogenalis]